MYAVLPSAVTCKLEPILPSGQPSPRLTVALPVARSQRRIQPPPIETRCLPSAVNVSDFSQYEALPCRNTVVPRRATALAGSGSGNCSGPGSADGVTPFALAF